MAKGEEESSSSVLESVEEAEFSGQHPWDPHKPSFSRLLPERIRPYPSFEGWYTRLVDEPRQFSAGVIMATNYATQESQVTLLFSDSSRSTHAVAVKTKDAKFSTIGDLSGADNDDEPKGFQWEAAGIGKIVMKPNESEVEVRLNGYDLRVETSGTVPWDSGNSKKGPEGWAGKVPLFPCHCSDKNMVVHGDGFAHQEKNWGETFPAGHVWLQGMSRDNSSQIVCSGARFKLGKLLETPYVFSLGYRSANCKLDLRTNNLGTIFKDVQLSPLEAKFALTGVGPSHTIKILCYASPVSFSEQILAPIGKLEWKPACRESFVATIEVEVFEHAVWGVANEDKLVDSQMFRCAALEFGEDLLEDALQQQDQSNPN
ncbi:hypothetical protein SELMODRAFT_441362 [Selaginella moellendorffii]|uniref:Uncharacterized protein n=1 Tax=Selaginella moellendorffii TaxID=88036 RepID=D8RIY9_SELML|nr:hypothetical protein SELMODRAFT_441362 [Selaginella moellendorffii]